VFEEKYDRISTYLFILQIFPMPYGQSSLSVLAVEESHKNETTMNISPENLESS
jgi:hypothetical protein